MNFLSSVAADELAGTPQSAEVRKEMLEAALDYYQGFLEDHQGATAVGVELNEAQSNVARILTELSAFEDFDRIEASAQPALRADGPASLKALGRPNLQCGQHHCRFRHGRFRRGRHAGKARGTA